MRPANLVPSACPQWLAAISGTLAFPKSAVLPAAQTLVYFINDGATFDDDVVISHRSLLYEPAYPGFPARWT